MIILFFARFFPFEFFATRFEESDNTSKKRKIARSVETRTTISGLIRCERIIRRGTRQARAIAVFWRVSKCFSREIEDRQRYNFGEFNSRSHTKERREEKAFARCPRYWNSPKSYWSEYQKGKKWKRKNINKRDKRWIYF